MWRLTLVGDREQVALFDGELDTHLEKQSECPRQGTFGYGPWPLPVDILN